jgi:predicted phage terminase large subunit-like protein
MRAEKARRRLIDFCTFTMPAYRAGQAHCFLASQLERVERGESDRLMLFCPPRTGKTELLIHFAAWCLGRHPDWSLLYTSYGADLAWEKSGESRQVVTGEAFAALWPGVGLDPASRSVQRWRIAGHRGGLQAQGVGGPLTGKGGKLIVIDDPVKNRQEADSPTFREATWRWYTSTLRTRLEPAGRMILVMTRWHEDDLAGRLLRQAAEDAQADQWVVVSLPALATADDPLGRCPGTALDPGRYDEAALAQIRASIGSRDWAALYEQQPLPAGGALFRQEWFKIAAAAPVEVQSVRYWDKGGGGAGSDYTSGVKLSRTTAGLFYVEDVVRGQWTALGRNNVIRQTADRDGPLVAIYVEQEGGSGGLESAEISIRDLAGYTIKADAPRGAKEIRALPFAAQLEAGNVYLVKGAWNQAYIDELISFPAGRNDDQVDATSGAFNKLTLARRYDKPGTARYT